MARFDRRRNRFHNQDENDLPSRRISGVLLKTDGGAALCRRARTLAETELAELRCDTGGAGIVVAAGAVFCSKSDRESSSACC
jgi:hypothetical protein